MRFLHVIAVSYARAIPMSNVAAYLFFGRLPATATSSANVIRQLIHWAMIETLLTAFTTFFAVIGPIYTAVLLASLTPNMTAAERRAISVKAVVIATIIIMLFALVGQPS
jgi:hypothetical protein